MNEETFILSLSFLFFPAGQSNSISKTEVQAESFGLPCGAILPFAMQVNHNENLNYSGFCSQSRILQVPDCVAEMNE